MSELTELNSFGISDFVFAEFVEHDGAAISRDLIRRITQKVLSTMNSARSNVSFILLKRNGQLRTHFGLSTYRDEPNAELHGRLLNLPVAIQPSDPEELDDHLERLTKCCGLMIGAPGPTPKEEHLLNKLTAAEEGDFGILVLAIPVPEMLVRDEILKFEQKYDRNARAQSVELTDFFERLNVGLVKGMWLTGQYFFAADAAVFARLEGALRKEIGHRAESIPSNSVVQMDELAPHILQFGLLKNKHETCPDISKMLEYKFLTPLTSEDLLDWIYMPGLN